MGYIFVGFLALQYFFDILGSAPALMKVLVCTFALAFYPGRVIYAWLEGKTDWIELVPLSFAFSFLVFVPLSLFKYVTGAGLGNLILAYLFCALLAVVFVKPKNIRSGDVIYKSNKDGSYYVLLAVLAASFFFAAYFGNWTSGDFVIHLPYIRKFYDIADLKYGNAFAKYLGKYDQSVYGYNVWHLFVVMISKVSHLDPIQVWAYISAFIVPVNIMAFYSAIRFMTRKRSVATLGTVLYFVWEATIAPGNEGGGNDHWKWSSSAYPFFIGILFMMLAVLYVFKYINTPGSENQRTAAGGNKPAAPKSQNLKFEAPNSGLFNNKYLYVVSALSVTVAFAHPSIAYELLFLVGCFFAGSLFYRQHYADLPAKLFVVMLAILIPGGICAVLQTIKFVPVINPWFANGSASGNSVYYLKNHLPIINPFENIWHDPLRCVSFATALLLLTYRPKMEKWMLYLSSIFVVTMFLFFNPYLLALLKKANPDLQRVFRLEEVVPYSFSIAAFLIFTPEWLKKIFQKYKPLAYAGILAAAVALVAYAAPNMKYLNTTPYTASKTAELLETNREFIQSVSAVIPAGSVVLIAREMTWYWPVFFSHYFISSATDTFLPPNFDPTERNKDLENFLNKPMDENSFRILDKYKVGYLVLRNKDLPLRNIDGYSDRLVPVLKGGALNIFKYKG
jgi:hypothetical protein